MPAIRAAFATAYAARYTSVYAGVGIMAVSFRVRCRGPLPRLSLTAGGRAPLARHGKAPAQPGSAAASSIHLSMTAMRCAPGERIAGPAIIEEREATTVIPPGDTRHRRRHRHACASTSAVAAAPAARITADTPIERSRGTDRGRSGFT